MEKGQGDLADIFRAPSGGGGSGGVVGDDIVNWRIPGEVLSFSSAMEEPIDHFGYPFSYMHDPLLHEVDMTSLSFFDRSNSSDHAKMNIQEDVNLTSTSHLRRMIFDEDMRRPTNNIFSRMLQISPDSKMSSSTTASAEMTSTVLSTPRIAATAKTSCSSANESIKSNSSSTGCSMESVGMMQISSPRNPGIKRRKSQAKKVVCIPAPAPAAANSSRPSGEVVPSDLWAWRKYGQKPIKGSPFPRGYYRCSSSKGCSARKQVERSRTDPKMLVITYTSEHNHPWPTQRNALAGSTRSQPPKNNAKSLPSSQTPSKLMQMKEEPKEDVNECMSISVVDGSINVSPSCIKEEVGDMHEKPNNMWADQGDLDSFRQNYRAPASLGSNLHPDDFFAELGELEYDPLNLLFTDQGFNGEKPEGRENKTLDPFSLFDWAGNSTMFGENIRGGA